MDGQFEKSTDSAVFLDSPSPSSRSYRGACISPSCPSARNKDRWVPCNLRLPSATYGTIADIVGFPARHVGTPWSSQRSLDGLSWENPNLKWMIIRSSPAAQHGNPRTSSPWLLEMFNEIMTGDRRGQGRQGTDDTGEIAGLFKAIHRWLVMLKRCQV